MLLGSIGNAVSAEPLRDQQVIRLWPGTAPGSRGVRLEEIITERSADPKHKDRVVTGITRPTLTAFVPRAPSGAVVLIAPGGGYVREVLDKESGEIATWLAARGVTAFVLKHRLPAEGHEHAADVPLQDAQRAMRLVRRRAARWRLDPKRVGFLGFSAGGHVASTLATQFAAPLRATEDSTDHGDARPDFLILLYPVISMQDPIAHLGSRTALLGLAPTLEQIKAHSPDQHVTSAAPPTFLLCADDDAAVLSEHSLRYYRALKHAGVPAELHVFSQGTHGFGIRGAQGLPIAQWPELMWTWLVATGVVERGTLP